MESQFLGIPHHEVDAVWPYVEKWVSGACERSNGRFDHLDIYEALKRRDAQLWVSVKDKKIEACCITEIIKYERALACRIRIGAGVDRENWQGFRKDIEKWAAANGCHLIEVLASKGWARVFDDYKMTHVFLEKELDHA